MVRQGSLSVLLVDLSALSQVEQDYGASAFESILASATDLILELRGSTIRSEDILATDDKGGDAFLIFLSQKRSSQPLSVAASEEVGERVEHHINAQLSQLASPYLRGRPTVTVGTGLVVFNPLVMPERLIGRLVDGAWESVRFRRTQQRFHRRSQLQDIILGRRIDTFYQPILELPSRTVHGFEALSRGPEGSEFRNPATLFEVAEECDLVFELDRLCRKTAFVNSKGMPATHKIFVNVLPSCMFDPDFQGSNLIELFQPLSISPTQIVLEITETCAIENYALFGEAVRNFTQMGFSIAVDDIGAGHSGLEKIAEVKPRYLKFDMSLVRDIHRSFVRREMMKAVKTFADKIGSTIIAEGIETEEEMDALVKLGIELGQGYLLGRPAPTFAQTHAEEAPVPA